MDPIEVDGSPEAVRERLERSLLKIGSVWFPTPREMRDWRGSSAPLYVRWMGERAFEIGPRLDAIRAARLCPVLKGRLEPVGDRTRLAMRLMFSPLTLVMFLMMGVMLAVWAAWIAPQVMAGTESPAWILFWALLAGFTLAGAVGGWRYGKAELARRVPWLRQVLVEGPAPGEEW